MSAMAKKRKTKRTTRPKGKHKRAKVTPCDVAGCTSKAGSKCQHCHACMCEGHVAAGYVCCSATGGESANPPRYLGPIKSKKGAEALANRLDRVGTDEATGAAEQLRRSWQYVAARPELGQTMEALAGVFKLTAKEKAALKAADARVERASRAYHSDFAHSPQDAERRQRDYDLALRERDTLRRPSRSRNLLGHSFVGGRCERCWCPLASQDATRPCSGTEAEAARTGRLAASEAMLGTAATHAVASVGGILLDRAARGRLQAEARAFGHTLVDSSLSCLRCGLPLDQAIENTCSMGPAFVVTAPEAPVPLVAGSGHYAIGAATTEQRFRALGHSFSNGRCTRCAVPPGSSYATWPCDPSPVLPGTGLAEIAEVFPVAAPAWAPPPPPPPAAHLAGTGVERLASSIAAERIVAPSRATPEWVGRMSAQPEAIAERAAAEAARLQRAAEFRARGARPAGVPAPRPYVPAPGGAERFRGLEFDPGAPVQHDPATEAGAERFRGLELWNPPRAVRRNGPTFDRPGYPFADKQAMYADMDTGSLQWSWADAIMARDASMGWNAVGETWYQDDASTIGDELRRRGAALGEEHLRAMKNREWRAQQAALAERYAKEQHAAAYAAPGAERFKGLELDRPRAYGEGAGGAERFRGLELSNPGDADLRALEREILSGHAYGMPQDHEQIERLNDMRQRYGLGRWDRARITQHQSPKYKSKWKGDHDWTTKAKALASVTRPRLFVDAILVDEIAYAPGSWDTVLLKRYLVANDRAGAEAAQRAHMAAFEKLSPSDKIARMTMNNPFFAPPALQYVAFANPPGDEDGWR